MQIKDDYSLAKSDRRINANDNAFAPVAQAA